MCVRACRPLGLPLLVIVRKAFGPGAPRRTCGEAVWGGRLSAEESGRSSSPEAVW